MNNDLLDNDRFSEPQEADITLSERVEEILEYSFDFNIGDVLQEAFDIFKQYTGGFIGFTLILAGINAIPNIIQEVIGEGIASGILNFGAGVISVPLGVGFVIVARKIYHREPYDFNNFFDGFQYFGQLILAAILVGISVMLGFILLIIPGIYLAVALSWTDMTIIFQKLDATDAMSISRKVISKNWFMLFAFYLVCFLVILAGFLALIVGLFVAIPVVSIASYIVYEKVIGTNLRQETSLTKMD